MKFLTIVTVAVAAFFAPKAQACAPPCRMNVSAVFADHYNPVLTKTIFNPLTSSLKSGLGGSSACNSAVSKAVSTAAKDFEADVVNQVFRAIFHDKPTFLVPCVYPKNVHQPKPPAIWTMADCKNMNYLCGNPPSICHFLGIAKSKNINRIKVTLHTDASPGGSVYKTITSAVQKSCGSSDTSKAASVIKTWLSKVVPTFCNKGCDGWDSQIQKTLLTFP